MQVMRTDIYEKDGNYLIEMDLPGYSKSDIQADLKEGYLTITAHDNETDEEKKKPEKPEKEPEEGSDGEEGKEKEDEDKDKKKKFPFQQDSMMYSTKAMNESFLSRVSRVDAMIPVSQLEKRLSLLTH